MEGPKKSVPQKSFQIHDLKSVSNCGNGISNYRCQMTTTDARGDFMFGGVK